MRFVFKTETAAARPRSLHETRTIRRFRIATVIIVGLSALVFLSSFAGDGSLVKIYQLSRDRREIEARVALAEARQQELLRQIEALKNDPAELERVAREELGLVKEGEVVFDFRKPGLANP